MATRPSTSPSLNGRLTPSPRASASPLLPSEPEHNEVQSGLRSRAPSPSEGVAPSSHADRGPPGPAPSQAAAARNERRLPGAQGLYQLGSPVWPPGPPAPARGRRARDGVEPPPPVSFERRQHLLAAIDERLNEVVFALEVPSVTQPLEGSLASYLEAFASVAQYDRTHLQGCVCRPALAGGACCPTGASSASLTPHVHGTGGAIGAHLSASMGVICGLGVGMAALSLKLSLEVMSLARDALTHLDEAAIRSRSRQLMGESRTAALTPWAAQLPATLAAHARRQQAESELRRELAEARSEQQFYRFVPGVLQAAAAVAMALGILDHVVAHALSQALGIGALGVVGPALFAGYGATFAARNAYLLYRDRAERGHAAAQAGPLGHALSQHARARRLQAGLALASWGLVAAMGAVGALSAAGVAAVGGLGAWLFVGMATLGIGAAVINACSRYAPHIPVGPHMDRELLEDLAQREVLRRGLVEQDAAVRAAAATLAAQRPPSYSRAVARTWEQTTQPQCGERAFAVVPRAVAETARLALDDDAAQALRVQDEATQLAAIGRYLTAERSMLASQLELERKQLVAQELEWRELFGVERLLYPQAPLDAAEVRRLESLLGEQAPGHNVLYAELTALLGRIEQHAVRSERLRAIDAARRECYALSELTGELSSQGEHACCLTPVQRRFAELRVLLLLLTGTLRDAVDTTTFGQLAALGAHRGDAAEWPYGLNNLAFPPHKLGALIDALTPTLDYGFVHAFFNPRRVEAEVDYVLTMGLKEPVKMGATSVSLDSATCCTRG